MSLWRLLAVTAALMGGFGVPAVQAQEWGAYAFVSSTMGVTGNRLCYGEASRGDIGCPTNAPYISPTSGNVAIGGPGVLQSFMANDSLAVSGTTYSTRGVYIANGFSLHWNDAFSRIVGTGGTSGAMDFYTSNTLQMRIQNGVGIGTGANVVSTALHVSGTIRIADGGQACDANRAGAIRYTSSSVFQFCSGSVWQSVADLANLGGGASDRITSGTTNVVANSDTGYVSFTSGGVTTGYYSPGGIFGAVGISTTSNQASFTTAYMSGNVGIGTSPSSAVGNMLTVRGSSIGQILMGHTGSSAYGIIGSDNNGFVRFASGNTAGGALAVSNSAIEKLRWNLTGVGIGTVEPSTTLHVMANGSPAWLDAVPSPTINTQYEVLRMGKLFNQSSPQWVFYVSDTSAANLRVHGNRYASDVRFSRGSPTGDRLYARIFGSESSNGNWISLYNSATAAFEQVKIATDMDSYINNGYKFGIGTDSPSGTFHVRTPTGVETPAITITREGATASATIKMDSNGFTRINTTSGGGLFTNSGNSQVMRWSSGGNVGIGAMANPSTSLHVSGTIRIADGGETCDGDRAGAIRYTSSSVFQFCSGSGWQSVSDLANLGGGASDRITSGTTNVVANSDTGYVSFTSGGTTTGYYSPGGIFGAVGISTTSNQASFTSLYASGRVGVGTATPSTSLHVMANANGPLWADSIPVTTNNTFYEVLRLGRQTASNFPLIMVSASDNGTATYNMGTNRYGFDQRFYRGSASGTLPILTIIGQNTGNVLAIGSSNSAVTAIRLATDGNSFINNTYNFGIGTDSPSSTLHVSGTGLFTGNVGIGKAAGAYNLDIDSDNSSMIRINRNTVNSAGIMYSNPSHTVYAGLRVNSGGFAVANTNNLASDAFFLARDTTSAFGSKLMVGISPSPTTQASVTLQVSGTIQIANSGETCDISRAGAIRYTSGNVFQVCYGSGGWATLASSAVSGTMGAEAISLTDLSDVSNSGALGSMFVGSITGSGNGVTSTFAMGHTALASTSLTGHSNFAIGQGALRNNSTGYQNLGLGFQALANNVSGSQNIAIGYNSLLLNSGGQRNIAIGINSLINNTTGQGNSAVGVQAMQGNVNGLYNAAFGELSLVANVSGNYNTAIGHTALNSSLSSNNTAVGQASLYSQTSGANNTGVGFYSLRYNMTGGQNTALGAYAMLGQVSGSFSGNTSLGYGSGLNLTTNGNNNTFVGINSGRYVTSGANNILIGADVSTPLVTTNNYLNIGNSIFGDMANAAFNGGAAKVGINTTAQSATLHVSGTVMVGQSELGSTYGALHVKQRDNTSLGGIVVERGTSTATGRIYVDGGNNLVLARGGGTANDTFVMTTAGSIGVGKSPVTDIKLDVDGAISISNTVASCVSSTAGGIRYNGGIFQFCSGSTWQGVADLANLGGGASDRITSGTTNVVANSDTGYVSFTSGGVTTGYYSPGGIFGAVGISTTSNQASFTTAYMSGNVGIGTTPTSTAALHVLGDQYISGSIGFRRPSDGVYGTHISMPSTFLQIRGAHSSSGNALALQNSGGINQFVMTGDGKFGMGANWGSINYLPSATLHVSGTGAFTSSVTIAANPATTPSASLHVVTNGPGAGFALSRNDSSYTYVVSNYNQLMNFTYSNGSAYHTMVVNGQNNRVGIAMHTNNPFPSTTLHVSGTLRIADSGELCDAHRVGGIRYTSSSVFQFCSGSGWQSIGDIALGSGGGDRLVSGSAVATFSPAGVLRLRGRIDMISTTNNMVAIGSDAAISVTGQYITAFGSNAAENASGSSIVFVGNSAGQSHTGVNSTGVGASAMRSNTGSQVTAFGFSAGRNNTGDSLTAFGAQAGFNNTANNSSFFGDNAGYGNSGFESLGMGVSSLYGNTAANVTAVGAYSGRSNIGASSTLIGYGSGRNNTGGYSTLLGYQTGYNNGGSHTVALGNYAGYSNTAQQMTAVGNYAGMNNTFTNVTVLGYNAAADKANQVVLGNSSVVEVSTTGTIRAEGVSVTGGVSATYFSGDGSRLTNLSVSGDRIVSGTSSVIAANGGSVTIATAGNNRMVIGNNGVTRIGSLKFVDTFQSAIEIGDGATGNQNSYIDFVGDATYSDWGIRMGREPNGPNSESFLNTRGTGGFSLAVIESGPIQLRTNNTLRVLVSNTGQVGIGFTNSTTLISQTLTVNGNAAVSGTIQLSGAAADTCVTLGAHGTLRVDPVSGKLQICRTK